MSDGTRFSLSPEAVLTISDALVAAEQILMRYNGVRIQLDADSVKANFAPDFRRLLRAKRLLSMDLTSGERGEIVSALGYADIAIALLDRVHLVDAAPPMNMDFGNAGDRVHAALEVLGVDQQVRGPFPSA